MQGTRVLAMASAYLCGVIALNEEARTSEISFPRSLSPRVMSSNEQLLLYY